jgi:Flp pilus assembly protein TadD
MRKIYFLILLSLCVACSSTSEQSTEATEDSALASGAPANRGQKSTEYSAPKATTSRTDANQLEGVIDDGNDDAVFRTAQLILAKNPNDIPALIALGVVHYKRGHWIAANILFDKVLKLDPKNTSARSNRGLVLMAQREDRAAIQEFKKVLEFDPTHAVAAANLGSIYLGHRDYQKAFIAYDIAHQKMSKDVKILNNYAISLAAVGRHKEAKDIYQKALDKSPGNKDIMLNYSILLIDHLKAYQQGLDLVNKVKFLGISPEVKNRINLLENTAKAGLK